MLFSSLDDPAISCIRNTPFGFIDLSNDFFNLPIYHKTGKMQYGNPISKIEQQQ